MPPFPHHHAHDSCTPDLARDLVVTGEAETVDPGTGLLTAPDRTSARSPVHGSAREPERGTDHTSADAAAPRRVRPVVEITPLSLSAEVVARSAQVPVVVLLGSPVDPGMSALRRELAGAASSALSSAGLRWILAVADADRFPTLVSAFRPTTLPVVTVVADGTGIAAWTPQDAVGEGGVDCTDWVDTVVGKAAPRLAGLPQDAVVVEVGADGGHSADDGAGQETGPGPGLTADSRLREAATAVSQGDPGAAVALYGALLVEYPDPSPQRTLLQARAAVRVLDRTQGLGRPEVYAALSRAGHIRSGDGDGDGDAVRPGVEDLLQTADVLVLDDRPTEAVDLLVESLDRCPTQDRDRVRVRALDLIRLLPPDAPATQQARRRLASALF